MKKKYISPKTRLIALDTEELMQQMLRASIPYAATSEMRAPMDARQLDEDVAIEYYPADPSIPQD